MERFDKIAQTARQQISNGSTAIATSSPSTPPRQNLGISREKITAMLNVLNKRWLTMGWRVMDKADAEVMAIAWIEFLDAQKIPHEHYAELYKRALDTRTRRLNAWLKCEDFSAELMAAGWPSLADELRRKRIEEKRYLPETAVSDCDLCHGSGYEITERGCKKCSCG